MKKKSIIITLLLGLSSLLSNIAAHAGDVDNGQKLSTACVQCHGEAGNKPIANYPKLAGQREKYLLYTLKSYQDGSRPNAIMAGQVSTLSASDLADLAAYFAAQSGELD